MMCVRDFPYAQGSFGKSWCNGIWAAVLIGGCICLSVLYKLLDQKQSDIEKPKFVRLMQVE